MSVAQIEAHLRKQQIEHTRTRTGSLLWPLTGAFGATHPLMLDDEQHGHVRLRAEYPICRLVESKKFFSEVSDLLPPGVTLYFNAVEMRLGAEMYMFGTETLEHCVETLLAVCDYLQPLCMHLVEQNDGKWDEYLVSLAFAPRRLLFNA